MIVFQLETAAALGIFKAWFEARRYLKALEYLVISN
jgi:hypothetical protein